MEAQEQAQVAEQKAEVAEVRAVEAEQRAFNAEQAHGEVMKQLADMRAYFEKERADRESSIQQNRPVASKPEPIEEVQEAPAPEEQKPKKPVVEAEKRRSRWWG